MEAGETWRIGNECKTGLFASKAPRQHQKSLMAPAPRKDEKLANFARVLTRSRRQTGSLGPRGLGSMLFLMRSVDRAGGGF